MGCNRIPVPLALSPHRWYAYQQPLHHGDRHLAVRAHMQLYELAPLCTYSRNVHLTPRSYEKGHRRVTNMGGGGEFLVSEAINKKLNNLSTLKKTQVQLSAIRNQTQPPIHYGRMSIELPHLRDETRRVDRCMKKGEGAFGDWRAYKRLLLPRATVPVGIGCLRCTCNKSGVRWQVARLISLHDQPLPVYLKEFSPSLMYNQDGGIIFGFFINSFQVVATGSALRSEAATGAGMKGQGKREIPEKTRRPTASSRTIPTCENPVTRPGIEPGSPLWEASVLIAHCSAGTNMGNPLQFRIRKVELEWPNHERQVETQNGFQWMQNVQCTMLMTRQCIAVALQSSDKRALKDSVSCKTHAFVCVLATRNYAPASRWLHVVRVTSLKCCPRTPAATFPRDRCIASPSATGRFKDTPSLRVYPSVTYRTTSLFSKANVRRGLRLRHGPLNKPQVLTADGLPTHERAEKYQFYRTKRGGTVVLLDREKCADGKYAKYTAMLLFLCSLSFTTSREGIEIPELLVGSVALAIICATVQSGQNYPCTSNESQNRRCHIKLRKCWPFGTAYLRCDGGVFDELHSSRPLGGPAGLQVCVPRGLCSPQNL
ncbi:hypothetical protein PR048_005670 [Dryococelus australis]|uniref:Uncharacterized protein n=1 Tax=Dryococelus australis TaxID=614101 RepID=A0ABQ9I8T6_9NEOP|nr:hypothetical protein PR048_005670 [Dryococelus australis]